MKAKNVSRQILSLNKAENVSAAYREIVEQSAVYLHQSNAVSFISVIEQVSAQVLALKNERHDTESLRAVEDVQRILNEVKQSLLPA